jgi:hypothetical protein
MHTFLFVRAQTWGGWHTRQADFEWARRVGLGHRGDRPRLPLTI